jgi:beta-glucosidase
MDLTEKAMRLVSQMTLEEKASLCSGKNVWYLKSIPRLGLPGIMLTDGPHGLRKQLNSEDNIGLSASIPAVCFPTASALACSFDRELLEEVGSAIGEECRQENVAVLLGPGMNIKRSPLCGRNFEYFSEDPYLSGHLAVAFIQGVQSQDVGTSLKHFAANNQEKRRLTIDAVIDERTLREIYLAGFEIAVKNSHPWTVMCAYNRVNGEYASQNKRLLTQILHDEWGFSNLVVSDWGATFERVNALAAGMDLEMPYTGPTNDARICQAVHENQLPEAILDQAAQRITELILKSQSRQSFVYDAEKHHALARTAAAESAVLLKNEHGLLPASPSLSAAVIGTFALNPRYQGTGSSKLTPIHIDNALDEFKLQGARITYAAGYKEDSDEIDENLVAEACQLAQGKDIVYIFAGMPDAYEAEGFDREDMHMPASHVALIEAVCAVNSRVVVVLHGGAPMEMIWADKVQAILLMYLGGESVGSATVDLLLGKTNPCGKLAESWPLRDSDVPAFPFFPGYPLSVEYREGLFVGYRFYDTANKPVHFPFGYGLSYTQFEYRDLKISQDQMLESDRLTIRCKVRNSGKRAGKEIVQLYIHADTPAIFRPEHELKGFIKIALQPGEEKEIAFELSARDLAFYNTEISDWTTLPGKYEIRIGASSRHIRLRGSLAYTSKKEVSVPDYRNLVPSYFDVSGGVKAPDPDFLALIGRPIPERERKPGSRHTLNSSLTDIQDHWFGRILMLYIHRELNKMAKTSPDLKLMAEKMLADMPLRFLATMGNGLSLPQIEGIVEILNGHLFKGLTALLAK